MIEDEVETERNKRTQFLRLMISKNPKLLLYSISINLLGNAIGTRFMNMGLESGNSRMSPKMQIKLLLGKAANREEQGWHVTKR